MRYGAAGEKRRREDRSAKETGREMLLRERSTNDAPPVRITACGYAGPCTVRFGWRSHSVNPRTFVLLLVTWLAFGSVFVAIKIGVGLLPPLLLGCLRFFIAGAVLYAITIRLPSAQPDPIGKREIVTSAIIGAGMAFVNGMVMLSSTRMDSWIVSVLTCTIPLWSYAAAVLFAHRKASPAEMAGMFLGVAGIVVLLLPSNESVHVSIVFSLLLLLGAMVWGGISVWEKSATIPKRPLVAMGLQMIFCGIVFAVWSAAAGELHGFTPAIFTPQALEAIAYLVVVASIVGYGAYMWLLVNAGATIGNSFGYVSPAIAVLLGWWLLHEPVTPRTFVGFALILVAVVLIVAPHPLRTGKPLEHRIH